MTKTLTELFDEVSLNLISDYANGIDLLGMVDCKYFALLGVRVRFNGDSEMGPRIGILTDIVVNMNSDFVCSEFEPIPSQYLKFVILWDERTYIEYTDKGNEIFCFDDVGVDHISVDEIIDDVKAYTFLPDPHKIWINVIQPVRPSSPKQNKH